MKIEILDINDFSYTVSQIKTLVDSIEVKEDKDGYLLGLVRDLAGAVVEFVDEKSVLMEKCTEQPEAFTVEDMYHESRRLLSEKMSHEERISRADAAIAKINSYAGNVVESAAKLLQEFKSIKAATTKGANAETRGGVS